MPRRALLHKYPVIGRFAHRLRRHTCLWSFRREDVRRAYYAGSVLAFLPLLGIQMPIAVAAAVVLRSNVMVMGGLQFLTNPVTAAPVYYVTHRLGELALDRINGHTPPSPPNEEIGALGGVVAESLIDPLIDDDTEPKHLTVRVREALRAMTLGGILVGLVAGGLLDLADTLIRRRRSPGPPPPLPPGPRRKLEPLSSQRS
jgi:hypothetical protein